MKITVYTINDCKFSQAEKEYLKKNNVEFEEKNLETNRDFLTEMLAVSNNFAGTPVTKVEKDSGEAVVLKGFTQEEFDKALGIASDPAVQSAQTAAVAASSTEMKNEEPAEAMSQPTETPEAKTDDSMPTPAQQTEISPVADGSQAAPAEATPTVVESLSQDDMSAVTPATNNEMQTPSPVEPMTPAVPSTNDSIGPISLSGDQPAAAVPPQSTEPAPATDVQAPVPETPDAASVPQQPVPQQPANDALNSVLQNLENQVKSTAPVQDGQKQ